MDLQTEFEAAWKAGADYDPLLELAHRHEQHGMTPREAYNILEQLWLDNGFDDCAESSLLQDRLEYVLEKLWYGQPAAK